MNKYEIQDKDFDQTGNRVEYVLTTCQHGDSFAVLAIPSKTPVEIRMSSEDGLSFMDYRFSTDKLENTGFDTLEWCKELIEECKEATDDTFVEVALQRRVGGDELKPIKWFCGLPN